MIKMTNIRQKLMTQLEKICDVTADGRFLTGKRREQQENTGIQTCHFGLIDEWYELWREGDIKRVDRIYNEYKEKIPEYWPFFILEIPDWYDYDAFIMSENDITKSKFYGIKHYYPVKFEDGRVFVHLNEYDNGVGDESFQGAAKKLLGISEQDAKMLDFNPRYFIKAIHSGVKLTKLPRFIELLAELGSVCRRLKLEEISDIFQGKSSEFFFDFINLKDSFNNIVFTTLKEVYGPKFMEECGFCSEVYICESYKDVKIEFHYDFSIICDMARSIEKIKPILLKYK